eukprot:521074-Rhodomonas_salina.3
MTRQEIHPPRVHARGLLAVQNRLAVADDADGHHGLDGGSEEDGSEDRAVEGLHGGLVVGLADALRDDAEPEEQRAEQHHHQPRQVVRYVAPVRGHPAPDVERDLAGVRGRVAGREVQLLALRRAADDLVHAHSHRGPLIALHKVDALV